MNNRFALSGIFCAISLHAMEAPQLFKVYHVPAIANKTIKETTKEELLTIAPDHLLQDEGRIEAIVIRPEKEKRCCMGICEITPTHIYGDKNEYENEVQDLAVVTMMRADVSHAVGGCYLPGDNLHVRGMRMGKKYLEAGDIITIIDAQHIVKAILLKTHMPHQACWKFQARCGKHAFNFCNNEDVYENGLEGPNGTLNGVEQRARGIRLAALKAGLVSIGDRVLIERGQAKEKRLAEFNLAQKAAELVEKSKEPGMKCEVRDAAMAQMRKNARLKKQAELL